MGTTLSSLIYSDNDEHDGASKFKSGDHGHDNSQGGDKYFPPKLPSMGRKRKLRPPPGYRHATRLENKKQIKPGNGGLNQPNRVQNQGRKIHGSPHKTVKPVIHHHSASGIQLNQPKLILHRCDNLLKHFNDTAGNQVQKTKTDIKIGHDKDCSVSGKKTDAAIHISVHGFQLKRPKLVLTRCDDNSKKLQNGSGRSKPHRKITKTKTKGGKPGISKYIQIINPGVKGEGSRYYGGVHRCKLCHRLFSLMCNAERHIKVVHMKEKRFQCVKCLGRFARKEHFHNHLLTHYGLNPYRCKICARVFKTFSSLRRHILVPQCNETAQEGM